MLLLTRSSVQSYEARSIIKRRNEFDRIFQERVDAVNVATEVFRNDVGPKARAMTPKRSFEARLYALEFLHPHFGRHPVDRIHCNKYEYILVSEGCFRLEDLDQYESFVEEDDRYDVDFDYVDQEATDCWTQKVVLTLKKWKIRMIRSKTVLKQKRGRMSLSRQRTVHNYEPKHIPKRIVEFDRVFHERADTVSAAKEMLRKDVGAKARTLSPKGSFDGRLRALHFLYPYFGTMDEPERIHSNKYKYTLYGEGIFRIEDLDRYQSFLMDDDRYDVEFDYLKSSACVSLYQDVLLTLKKWKIVRTKKLLKTKCSRPQGHFSRKA
jgi:hypothetical protein